jgi:hypothetical protein
MLLRELAQRFHVQQGYLAILDFKHSRLAESPEYRGGDLSCSARQIGHLLAGHSGTLPEVSLEPRRVSFIPDCPPYFTVGPPYLSAGGRLKQPV